MFQLTHGAVWCAVVALVVLSQRLGDATIFRLFRWLGYLGVIVYLVLLSIAPFGIGALGRQLTKAAREDERDNWISG